MRKEKKALLLVLLIMVDYCQTAAPIRLNVDRNGSENISPNEEKAPNNQVFGNKEEGKETEDNTSRRENLYEEKYKSSDVKEKFEKIIEQLRSTTDIKGAVDCNDFGEEVFHQQIKEVPLALEYYDIATAILYRLSGCDNVGNQRLEEMLALVDDDRIIKDIFDEIEELSSIDSNMTDGIFSYGTGDLNNALQNLIDIVQLMDGVFQHDTMEPITLKCRWKKLASKEIYGNQHQVIIEEFDGITLPYAKYLCENRYTNCSSVRQRQGSNDTIWLIGTTSRNHQVSQNDTIWMKNCFSNTSMNGLGRPLKATHQFGGVKSRRRRLVGDHTSIIAFEHIYYGGQRREFSSEVEYVGKHWNDKISSLKCTGVDCTVIVFEHKDYTGRQVSFHKQSKWIGKTWNDKISSMVALPYDIALLCYTVYEHSDYEGESGRFCGDQSFTSTKLKGKISSFKFDCHECSIVVYDGDYIGNFKAFDNDTAYVGKELNDRIKTIQIRPWKYGAYEGHMPADTVLYSETNYKGKSKIIQGVASSMGRSFNDKTSSIQCEEPCTLVVFEHNDFKGNSIAYQDSQSSLSGFNNIISSIVVIREHICVTIYQHADFKGRYQKICHDVGNLNKNSLFGKGYNWNDQISSIKVNCKDCSVLVFQHSKFEGSYKSFRGDIKNVGSKWNDRISSLQIRPWEIDNVEYEVSSSKSTKTKSCVDSGEKKAYDVIQWIPIVSLFYNLGTSIYYAAKKCNDVAKERAIGLALDAVMDIATVVTAGAAAPAALGIKTGVKLGAKVGIKVAMKATKVALKKAIKNIVKKGIKGNIKSFVKGQMKQVKNIAWSIKKAPKAIGKGIKTGIKSVKNNGLRKSLKNFGKNVKNSFKNKFDDLAVKAKKDIDGAAGGSTGGANPVKGRCRRVPGGCQLPNSKTKLGNLTPGKKREIFEEKIFRQWDTFDTNKDGYIMMYRKVGEFEKDLFVTNNKMAPLKPSHNKITGEKWLSTSAEHTKAFDNAGVTEKQYVIQVKVDVKEFKKSFKDRIANQKGSKTLNKGRSAENVYNVINYEQLNDHRYKKFNLGLKGERNIERFDQILEHLETVSDSKFMRLMELGRLLTKRAV
ncbi:uncharacterized protein [Clytia hemisphaerica]